MVEFYTDHLKTRTNKIKNRRSLAQIERMQLLVKMVKNGLSEFKRNNWTKIACGNISSQALSTCLAESQFERCAV
jgi:hypothetical protein